MLESINYAAARPVTADVFFCGGVLSVGVNLHNENLVRTVCKSTDFVAGCSDI